MKRVRIPFLHIGPLDHWADHCDCLERSRMVEGVQKSRVWGWVREYIEQEQRFRTMTRDAYEAD